MQQLLYYDYNVVMNCGRFVKVSGKIDDVPVTVVIIAIECGPGKYFLSLKERKRVYQTLFIRSSGLLYLYLQHYIIQYTYYVY